MCEPVDLDEWVKEIDTSHGPRNFSDRIPEVKAASEIHTLQPMLDLDTRHDTHAILHC